MPNSAMLHFAIDTHNRSLAINLDVFFAQRTYQIRKLVERRMLAPIREGARQYTVGFSNSYLIRGVIRALSAEGFIPDALNRPR